MKVHFRVTKEHTHSELFITFFTLRQNLKLCVNELLAIEMVSLGLLSSSSSLTLCYLYLFKTYIFYSPRISFLEKYRCFKALFLSPLLILFLKKLQIMFSLKVPSHITKSLNAEPFAQNIFPTYILLKFFNFSLCLVYS